MKRYLSTGTYAPGERVDEQVAAERSSVLGAIERQTREQQDRNGVGHSTP